MRGYQLTFFTQQDRKHGHQPVAEWLMLTARSLNIRGATMMSGTEGFGHDRHLHSVHFFELADQPVEVTMAVTEEQSERLFAILEAEQAAVFYVKTPVEFGVAGESPPPQ